jgi:photosynthetic reaction center H subunit
MDVNFTGYMDLTQVVLYLFWAFFFVLVLYIQQEGRREGFPLVSDPDGKPLNQDIWMPKPKTFHTNDGRTVLAPDPNRADTRDLNAEFVVGGPGSPIVPTGNPMTDSIGPGAYALRPDIPDTTFDMRPRIVPMRVDADFSIAETDIDPRGKSVFGCDGEKAGVVSDVWVDRSDFIIRYVEVELPGTTGEDGVAAPGAKVLVPWAMVDLKTTRDWLMEFARMKWERPDATLHVRAIKAEQFAGIPQTTTPDQVTLLEEEKIMGYIGGGYLYATPERQEPLV